MLKIKHTLVFTCLLFIFPGIMHAQEQELGIYEHLDDYLPKDLVFVSQNYDTVNLMSLIDKPTLIVPVYYECPGLCSPLLEGVADVIGRADMTLGKDYQIFTVSFNPAEKPKLAQEKKASYLKLVKGDAGDLEHGWTFFTGDSANIYSLLNSIGYKVKKTGKDYIHPGAVVVVSSKGKITRYLNGTYFLPFDLKMAIVEASKGQSGPTINKVLQFCFSYDPKGQKYVFNITKVSGSIILLFALSLFGTLVLKKRKKEEPNPEKYFNDNHNSQS